MWPMVKLFLKLKIEYAAFAVYNSKNTFVLSMCIKLYEVKYLYAVALY